MHGLPARNERPDMIPPIAAEPAYAVISARRSVSGAARFSIPESPIRTQNAGSLRLRDRDPAADTVELSCSWPELVTGLVAQSVEQSQPAFTFRSAAGQDKNSADRGTSGAAAGEDDPGRRPLSAGTSEDEDEDEDAGQGLTAGEAVNARGEPLDDAELREVDELKSRDREVRQHEQTHKSVGGQYAGSVSYEYQQGPDGQRYAVGGEVSIDVSREKDPSATAAKMRQVRAAALAPAQPSAQDRAVAAEASRKESEARTEMRQETAQTAAGSGQTGAAANQENDSTPAGAAQTGQDAGSASFGSGSAAVPAGNRMRPQSSSPDGAVSSQPAFDISLSSGSGYSPSVRHGLGTAFSYAPLDVIA